MKTKVVEFIGRIQDGGAETLIKDYALFLNKEKFDVVILCEDYRPNSTNYKTLVKNNVNIVVMYEKSFFINKVLARLLGKRYVSWLFKKYIKKIKPDIIHAHLELLEVLYYASDVLKDIKLLFTCHNTPELLIGDKMPRERDACRYLLEHNNFQIIALHENMAKDINQMFEINNTAVIRNAINLERFRDVDKTKEEIKASLNIGKGTYVIGQIGRYAYQKNPEFSITVFKELIKKKNDSCLLLIGRGPQEARLRKMIREYCLDDKVRLLVSRDDIPELLKAMDVFIFPSRFEGLGIVLIEAQASGLPCVVSDNIPHEAFKSNRITKLSLEESTDIWVNALLNPQGNIDSYGDINEYDMKKEIRNLEDIYLSD